VPLTLARRTLLVTTAAAVGLAFALTGCSGSGGGTDTPSASSTATSIPTVSAACVSSGSASDSVKVTGDFDATPNVSLDAPLTPGEDNKLLDYLPDTLNPTPDEQTFEKALTESIEEALSHLKERESKILRLYFGLDGSEPMTLEEIGALLGITRERVRQIKEKALSRLRHVSRARALESYLG